MAWNTEQERAKELKKIIGKYFDPIYAQDFKIPKYNGRVTVLNAHGTDGGKILARSGKWTREQHLKLVDVFGKKHSEYKRKWGEVLDKAAMETFGRPFEMTDYKISGIGREEFSEKRKDEARHYAHGVSVLASLIGIHADAAKIQKRMKYTYSNPAMKASYRRSGMNYLPVIVHGEGKRETIYGDPLITKKDAMKYSQIEINSRYKRK